MTDSKTISAIVLMVATVAFGLAPIVSPPMDGYDPAMFPVQIERPSIQPASYAFSIWIVIYLWLIAHAAYGLWKRRDSSAWQDIRLPLTIAVVVGAGWLYIASQSPVWGTITIWIMAAAAIAAFLGADPDTDRWMLSAPIAMFAGWLSAAAAVSTGILIAGYGWLTDTQSAAAMLALVLAIAVTVQMRGRRMPVYGLTVIWALIGIVVANWVPNMTVALLAAAGIIVMAVTLVATRRA